MCSCICQCANFSNWTNISISAECVRPKGNDAEFVQKALSANSKSPCLLVNKIDRMSFGVHHFAGKVMYSAAGFVASNQDTLPTDLIEIGEKSSNPVVKETIEEESPVDSGKRSAPVRQKSNLVAPTIWVKYKVQLSSLMGNLRKTSSRYIRCVKPNTVKKPSIMEHISTVEQLRSAGVVAAVTLARSAFPNRLDNSAVKFRFGSMWEDKKKYPSAKKDSMTKEEALRLDCDAILANALDGKDPVKDKNGDVVKQYVCGKTRSYFKAGALEYLEANRSTGLDTQARTIQRIVRGMLGRKRVDDMMGASKQKVAAEREAALRAERERKERKEREERERKEKFDREKAERDAQRKGVTKTYNDKIEDLKAKIQQAELDQAKKLAEINKRKEEAQRELDGLKESTGDEARAAIMEPKKIAAQQKKKLEDAVKTIESLKKENKKIRKDHAKIKSKWDVVMVNNDKLMTMNEGCGQNFEEKEDLMRKVDTKNMTLMDELDEAKSTNAELKEECMEKQDDYMTQAETRLEYQKTMARILNLIQESSKDARLVEDTCAYALDCEGEAKGIMAALEAETADC